jgi:pimeloyl-ACP methyl ester carboxylesterase
MPFLRIDQSEIHYESIRIENPISDYIIIFLHEALGSIPQWRNFPEECCKKLGMNGIVYERQGHGNSSGLLSDRTDSYLHEYALKELPRLIDNLVPPTTKLVLIGHSDGGSIALIYAAHYSKRVAACITMAGHVINEPETIAGIQPAVKAYEDGKLDKLQVYHRDKTDTLFYAWANTWKRPSFAQWNICKEITCIIAPVLAIQGQSDQYGTIRQLELIQENVSGNSEIHFIPNCGHHPHLEKGTDVISIIGRFLNHTEQ